jgi:hypothetical protein
LQSLPYSHRIPWSSIHHKHEPEGSQHSSDIASRGLPTHLQLDSKWYGRWSRWSPCSISCTTQRYRFVCVTYSSHLLQSSLSGWGWWNILLENCMKPRCMHTVPIGIPDSELCRILLEKLTIAQPVKKSPTINQKGPLLCSQSPPPFASLSQMSLVNTLKYYFLNFDFNIIFPSVPWSSK